MLGFFQGPNQNSLPDMELSCVLQTNEKLVCNIICIKFLVFKLIKN